jgi:hypothetical protein
MLYKKSNSWLNFNTATNSSFMCKFLKPFSFLLIGIITGSFNLCFPQACNCPAYNSFLQESGNPNPDAYLLMQKMEATGKPLCIAKAHEF